jgi:hypothetical protein
MARPTPRRETQGAGDTDGENDLRAMAHHDFLQPPKNKLSHTGLNWSVSRVLGISLVADGSCNGRNPDLSVVALYCLIFGAFQSFTFLPALFGNNRSDVFHYWNLIPILTSEDSVVGEEFVRIGRQMVHSRDVS